MIANKSNSKVLGVIKCPFGTANVNIFSMHVFWVERISKSAQFIQLPYSWALSRMNFQVKDFEYSMKNIPLPSKNAFLQTQIAKTESLIQRMRWKAFFFLNKNTDDTTKSKRSPPHVKELNEFEDWMLNMNSELNSRPTPILTIFRKSSAKTQMK